MEFKRTFKFPAGAHLLKRDHSGNPCALEPIEGESFELRVTSKKDVMDAKRNARQWDTDPDDELTRLSFISWRGQTVKQPFAEFTEFDTVANSFVSLAWSALNIAPEARTDEANRALAEQGLGPLDPGTTTEKTTTK